MSNAVVASSTLIGAAIPVAVSLMQRCSGAVVESGIDPVKLSCLLQAVAGIPCDPEIDAVLEMTSRIKNEHVNPLTAAILAEAPKVLIDVLLNIPAGRALVAIVSIWSLLLADGLEMADRLGRFTNAASGQVRVPFLSVREMLVGILPAFAENKRQHTADLYASLLEHEHAWIKRDSMGVKSSETIEELSAEIMGAVVSCNQQAKAWIEIINFSGVTDTIVTMALVTGWSVAVFVDDVQMPVDDERCTTTKAKDARFLIKYNTGFGRATLGVCSTISSSILVNYDIATAPADQGSFDIGNIGWSVLYRNSVTRLRELSEEELKQAIRGFTALTINVSGYNDYLIKPTPDVCSIFISRALHVLDCEVGQIDGSTMSDYMRLILYKCGGSVDLGFSAISSLFTLFNLSLINSLFGDKCECFFVNPRKLTGPIHERLFDTLFSSLSHFDFLRTRFAPDSTVPGSESDTIPCSTIMRVGPYTVAPRCFVESGIHDHRETPFVVLEAVISVEGGCVGMIFHELPPPLNYISLATDFVDEPLTAIDTTSYQLVLRRRAFFYRAFEGRYQIDMNILIRAISRTITGVPDGWNQVGSKGWTCLKPGNPADGSRVVYRTHGDQAIQRLATVRAYGTEVYHGTDCLIVIMGLEAVEETKGYAEHIGVNVIIA